jgi:hypothetical protein
VLTLYGKELAELLEKADKAMYQVKQQGRKGCRFLKHRKAAAKASRLRRE